MRTLVVGGSGFIGSHVVDRLHARGDDVRVFDLAPFPYAPEGEVETVVGDILDVNALRMAMRGCDAAVHLAAMANVDEVLADPRRAEAVNAQGTLNVLEAAGRADLGRLVYASTVWVYGDHEGGIVDEDAGLGLPRHLYTATKLAGEMYCRSYAELYGVEDTILRFGIPYGPRARPEAVVPRFVLNALEGRPLTIAGDGSQSRRFVYVEDLADGVVAGLRPEAANRVYNLVGHENVTILQIAQVVARALGDVEIVHVEGRPGDLRGAEISGERARRELGWTATTTFEEGVHRYIAWLREELPPSEERATAALDPV